VGGVNDEDRRPGTAVVSDALADCQKRPALRPEGTAFRSPIPLKKVGKRH
jgi:hypothetical protein